MGDFTGNVLDSPGWSVPDGRHRPSHLELVARVPDYGTDARTPRVRLGGVFVPTHRSPDELGDGIGVAAGVAASKDSPLILLRSGKASRAPFPRDLAPRSSHRTAVIDLGRGAGGLLPTWRSAQHRVAKLHGRSDLGLKRNLALLIGRRCGWDAVLMLDDDISTRRASQVPASPDGEGAHPTLRLDDVMADFHGYPQLRAAGYVSKDFADNSVVCHARRLAGWPQEGFIGAGALVVRPGGRLPLPFFPPTYNEDWLFCYVLMLQGPHVRPSATLKRAGVVHQRAYYPYSPERARSQEPGDALAEGLFRLLALPRHEVPHVARSVDYWTTAVTERQSMIIKLLHEQRERHAFAEHAVLRDVDDSLRAALAVYDGSAAEWGASLAQYVGLLMDDLEAWEEFCTGLPAEALDLEQGLVALGLGNCVTWVEGRRHARAFLPGQRNPEAC